MQIFGTAGLCLPYFLVRFDHFFPSLISLMVSVDVKHHVDLLYRFFSFLLKAGSFETLF